MLNHLYFQTGAWGTEEADKLARLELGRATTRVDDRTRRFKPARQPAEEMQEMNQESFPNMILGTAEQISRFYRSCV